MLPEAMRRSPRALPSRFTEFTLKTASIAANVPAASAIAPGEPLRVAAGLFRRQGLGAVTMTQLAVGCGLSRAEFQRHFATKDLLAQALFAETIRTLRAADSQVWQGYGAGMGRTLRAARTVEDAYVVLVRDAATLAVHQPSWQALRRRTAQRLRALIWNPHDPPPAAERPPQLALAVEPMVSFCIDAIATWIQTGDPSRDDLFMRWCGQMLKAWRYSTCELLNLDTPDQDWPFDPDDRIWDGRSGPP